jgi:hypothetical protein
MINARDLELNAPGSPEGRSERDSASHRTTLGSLLRELRSKRLAGCINRMHSSSLNSRLISHSLAASRGKK